MEYPITVKLDVHITDGQQVGSATFVHGHAKLPTEEEMAGILERVKGSVPEGFRLMNRAESAMFYLREERGYRGPNMVIPKTGEWHDKADDVDFALTGHEPETDDDEYDV